MIQPTGKSNAELSRRYVEAVMCPDERHGLVERHGADRVLRAANTLAVLAIVDAVREGPTPLRDCIAALAPQLQPRRYKVGDPDPTPDLIPEIGFCDAETAGGRFVCSWPAGHDGDHVCGSDDAEILAVWS